MSQQDLPLFHLVRESNLPDGKAPLLIMLHGYGSDENDLFSFASELSPEFHILSLRAPYKLQPYGYAWYAINFDAEKGKWSDNEQAKSAIDLIAECLDKAIENYPVDPNNITLLGFSQGSILSLALALTYPEKVKNVVALSGYLNREILPKNLDPEAYNHLEIYCSHGTADQVIPVEWARKTQPFLNQLGIQNQYSEFPVGHGVAPQNFFEFNSWLNRKL